MRRYLDPYFVLGGHDLVYSYIPKNTVWLDDVIDQKELPYILLHEKEERNIMEKGKSYDVAHRFAIAIDQEARIKDGLASYPGFEDYIFQNLTDKEIIKKYAQ